MIQDIQYSGHACTPSGMECPDGQLSLSLNLINEGNGLVAVKQGKKLFQLPQGTNKVFLHSAGDKTNYIAYNSDGRFGAKVIRVMCRESNGELVPTVDDVVGIVIRGVKSIKATGMVLVMSTAFDTHYSIYNKDKDAYTYLGTELPDLELSFGLRLTIEQEYTKDTDLKLIKPGDASECVTPDDGWGLMTSRKYEFTSKDLSPADYGRQVSTFIELNPGVALTKGTEYKIFLNHPITGRDTSIAIYGIDKWGNDNWVGSCGLNTMNKPYSEHSFICREDFTQLRIRYSGYFGNNGVPDTFRFSGDFFLYSGSEGDYDDTTRLRIDHTQENADIAMGQMLRFIKTHGAEKRKFIYPFFVRYALRMYDGTYAKVSPPVLLIPNSGAVPQGNLGAFYLWYGGDEEQSVVAKESLMLWAFAGELDFCIRKNIPNVWENVILGVDVFMTPPIYTFDQGKTFDPLDRSMYRYAMIGSNGIGDLRTPYEGYNPGPLGSPCNYVMFSLDEIIKQTSVIEGDTSKVNIAPLSTDEILAKVRTASTFYKVASIDMEDLLKADINKRELLPMEDLIFKDNYENIKVQQRLEEPDFQYRGFANGTLSEYNSRLHVCSPSLVLPTPAPPDSLECFSAVAEIGRTQEGKTTEAYVRVSTTAGDKYVKTTTPYSPIGAWYFYPDNNAKEVIVDTFKSDVSGKRSLLTRQRVPLKEHPMLNGAYFLADSLTAPCENFVETTEAIPYTQGITDYVSALSTVYVSDVNNPFKFRESSAVNIPAAQVMGIIPVSQALSQGQFGVFPVYAFTDNGVWAMQTAATGAYEKITPVSRDVCINPDCIAQLDSSIVFPTDRGIMELSGSKVECISDSLWRETTPQYERMPGMRKLHRMAGFEGDTCLCIPPLKEYMKGVHMAYDYPNQRIVFFNRQHSMAYVFSAKSGKWGMMHSDLWESVHAYPEALAIDKDGWVLELSSIDASTQKGLVLTRPLKLGAPYDFKTIETLIQRGTFKKGHVKSVLYGSRNLDDWHLVWSSQDHVMRGFRGTPYKYFRIATVCDLAPGEYLQGASVQFNPRLGNRVH